MRRGTTPTLRFKVKGIGVEELDSIFITLKQGNKELTKTNEDVTIDEDENRLIVTLTQEETLNFNDGVCQLQLRATTDKGGAVASSIVTKQWEHILMEGEIE